MLSFVKYHIWVFKHSLYKKLIDEEDERVLKIKLADRT